jgi:lipoyl(octanoyl) transferase
VNVQINKKTAVIDLGLKDYKEAWDYQTSLFEKSLAIKVHNRSAPEENHQITSNYLLFCEHPHVYTLGKSGKESNLLVAPQDLDKIHATYYHINRGGDITYHGPGQIVVYPILDLENFFTDIHQYMRLLEESIIRTCTMLGVSAGRIKGLTGVWVGHEDEKNARKIAALGVKTSRWVTMHGLAFNVNADLNYFNHIVPCGIVDKAVTSLERELGTAIPMLKVQEMLRNNIVELFEMEVV